ncbi:aldehyde dehydrogenase [Rhizobium sp. Leaf386]|uniref:aldehyde dehydrogenase n=1 Tax=Rhizobium sp. Leaf386 TaxID=1736359 RepID=UPI000714BA9D|nr:aldehyde dehydrogenase [Rhizobium sp. Leaf386]KQT02763.1 aldehyde dehydrogenase [Rhizobium sp. Leaf386]
MATTLEQLVKHPQKFYIGGAWVSPSSHKTIAIADSATEELFGQVAEAEEEDINKAVAAARHAFDYGPWPKMTHGERAAYMTRLADELDKRLDDLAKIWTIEAGIVYSLSRSRIVNLPKTYRYYAALATSYAFEELYPSESGGAAAILVREPVGVVGAIVPWNDAPGLAAKKVAPALLAGCTVILKSSPESPGAAYVLAEAAEAAGFPDGVLNILTADRLASERLVAHSGVDKIAFTGSTAAGRKIASVCGERVARVTLELGGKSPAVVLDDYDIETAAEAIATKSTFLTGQVCAALSRVIVPRHRHDEMVDALRARFEKIKVGDPFASWCEMGPLAMRRQLEKVESYIAKGTAEGARLVTGGKRPADIERGFFIEPTIFGNVDNTSTIGREEIFGPVLSVIPARDEQEAVAIANETNFGLNAAVFTNDIDRAYSVARQIRSGTVGHNSYRTEVNLSFGGFKQSGIGREGGKEGLLPYLETKVIVVDQIPDHLKSPSL